MSSKNIYKRQALPHMKLQIEIIKKIAAKENIKYFKAHLKLKDYIIRGIGGDHKEKGMEWMDALKKTNANI